MTTDDVEFLLTTAWRVPDESDRRIFDVGNLAALNATATTNDMDDDGKHGKPRVFGDSRLEVFELGRTGFADGAVRHKTNQWKLCDQTKMHRFYSSGDGNEVVARHLVTKSTSIINNAFSDYVIGPEAPGFKTLPHFIKAQSMSSGVSAEGIQASIEARADSHINPGVAIDAFSSIGLIGSHFTASYGLYNIDGDEFTEYIGVVSVLNAIGERGMCLDWYKAPATIFVGGETNSGGMTYKKSIESSVSAHVRVVETIATAAVVAGVAAVGAVTKGIGPKVILALSGLTLNQIVSAVSNAAASDPGTGQVTASFNIRRVSREGVVGPNRKVGKRFSYDSGTSAEDSIVWDIVEPTVMVGDAFTVTGQAQASISVISPRFGHNSVKAMIKMELSSQPLLPHVHVESRGGWPSPQN